MYFGRPLMYFGRQIRSFFILFQAVSIQSAEFYQVGFSFYQKLMSS